MVGASPSMDRSSLRCSAPSSPYANKPALFATRNDAGDCVSLDLIFVEPGVRIVAQPTLAPIRGSMTVFDC